MDLLEGGIELKHHPAKLIDIASDDRLVYWKTAGYLYTVNLTINK